MNRKWISFAIAMGLVVSCGPVVTPDVASRTEAATAAAAVPATSTVADYFGRMQIVIPPPVCDGSFTPAQTEGPYYTPDTPERNSLVEPGMHGTHLILVGYVLNRDCQPLPGAWLDFWQADASGTYDNAGFTLRGHQFTDGLGRYYLESVRPGEYPGRTAHIHVKIQPSGGDILTSQLYFPDVAQNSSDGIFVSSTVVGLESRPDGQIAYYNFVLDVP